MEFVSRRFGTIQVEDSQILTVENGLIGFPELSRFVLINMAKQAPFRWFQSLDEESIAFVVLNPATIKPDYTITLTQSEFDRLNLQSPQDAVLAVIATIGSTPSQTTVNLKAPLIFNRKNRKGLQLILRDPNYQTQHNLSDELLKAKRQIYQSGEIPQVPSIQVVESHHNLR